jgi:hypothetical protein
MREAVDPLSKGPLGWRRLGGKRRDVHARIATQAPRYRQHDGPTVFAWVPACASRGLLIARRTWFAARLGFVTDQYPRTGGICARMRETV